MKRPLLSKTQNICLVILWILFLLLAGIMVKQLLDNRKTKEKAYDEVAIDSSMVSKAMDSWKIDFCDGFDDAILKMYSGDFSSNDLSKEDLLLMVLRKNEKKEEMTISEINDGIDTLVIDDHHINEDELKKIVNERSLNDFYYLELNDNKLLFHKIEQVCENQDKNAVIKMEEAKENGKHLIVKVNFLYGVLNINDEGLEVFDYYESFDEENIRERVSKEDVGKVSWNKGYSNYEFKFLIKEDSYLLESIKLVKD